MKQLLKQNLLILKEEVFSCVKELREDVVGISNETNKAIEKKVILVAEELEIEKRKNNLIFFGIKAFGIKENGTMSDKDTVDEILRERLKFDSSRHVEDVSRVGRFSSDKIRPIRVKLFGIESKKEILQRSKSLSSGTFNKGFIAPNLTKKQQEHYKDLTEHGKLFTEEYKDKEIKIKIKGEKVVKNEQGNRI